ncbi:MAG: hypothetical protein D6744_14485 [Planctomycetota bacterium]|nr:MAG: hypothetical protein D6744_14485 [Planctomycetota bacterium]
MQDLVRFLTTLDRRWIFLLMGLAVLIPILLRASTKETPGKLTNAVFEQIEKLPPGSKVLLAYDYDPGSRPELEPMARSFAWHCAKRGHKLYFMALWPLGAQMISDTIDNVIKKYYPEYKYGVDYVNLGFKPGNEGVIKVVISNMRELYTTDHAGTSLTNLPMTKDLKNIADMDLIVNVSAGYPGTKEWVQYAATPLKINIVGGCTGVQAPLLFPYIPNQLQGLLAAIKGAAEYEARLAKAYPDYAKDPETGELHVALTKGMQRMGPQTAAHCLILALIVLGNIIMALGRRTQGAA